MLSLSKTIISWYNENKRTLPWRDISDAYRIWISEIILQQTRVNQGLGYYLRFVERFPDIATLAAAQEDEVLKYWQGLGYYSRARNLHKTARQLMEQYNGYFPKNHAEILKLSGIGTYTAAAISSFAYNDPFPVVDGNVYRVLSRFYGIETPIDTNAGKKEYAQLAELVLDKNQAGLHNQALMEFGALQCVPVQPECEICPLQKQCQARLTDRVSLLPVKLLKTKVRPRYFNYFFIQYKDTIFLQKRTANDIWKNLYELPLIESEAPLEVATLGTLRAFQDLITGIEGVQIETQTTHFKHILSHQRIFAQFFKITVSQTNEALDGLVLVSFQLLANYAISRLTEMYFEKLDINCIFDAWKPTKND
ncbi:MAG: A/G-specific adenine glycosylase [Porphyromonadaceae bacterium CG2_30_38_12]|nr:MAG: A/G-specific adenine glycosylase [Porphyromonadaceae bacterium CG2_30_38_12]